MVFIASRRVFSFTSQLLAAFASWSRFWRHDWITVTVQTPEVVLSGVAAGWLIARLHRQNPKAMVLAYAAYFVAAQILRIALELVTDPFRYFPFAYAIAFIIMMTVGVLLGGGFFNGHRDEGGTDRRFAGANE